MVISNRMDFLPEELKLEILKHITSKFDQGKFLKLFINVTAFINTNKTSLSSLKNHFNFSNTDLNKLAPHLEFVDLKYAKFFNPNVLKNSSSITTLYIDILKGTDFISSLLNLKSLTTSIGSNEELKQLKGLPQLESLHILHARYEGIDCSVFEALSSLRTLKLWQFNGLPVQSICKLSYLEELEFLSGNPLLANEDFSQLSKLSILKFLNCPFMKNVTIPLIVK